VTADVSADAADSSNDPVFQRRYERRVFTIPPGTPFLPALTDALLSGRLVPGFPEAGDPASLAKATIYLPTRRAARALAALIAERHGGATVLMPRILPLGDVDAAEFALADGDHIQDGGTGLEPAIPDMERRLILTGLVLAWARAVRRALLPHDDAPDEPLLVPSSPADAFALASDAARLMDTLALAEVPWTALSQQAEERFDPYYRITVDFLAIAATQWPAILAERGASDPAVRRDRLIRAEAARLLASGGTGGPVIAAGSTGSVPATAALLAAIARMPNGAVVLPGLDQTIDETLFAALTDPDSDDPTIESHPQTALARLLPVLGIARHDVSALAEDDAIHAARARLIAETLRPAAFTDAWSDPDQRLPDAAIAAGLDGLSMVIAADEREEALTIAIAIRETLETPDATVALITPDRVLAERVAAELARWHIDADDTAGEPLGRSQAGSFARLIADVAISACEPIKVLALAGHRHARFGLSAADIARARSALEIGALRGPAPPAGFAGLGVALERGRERAAERHAPIPVKRLEEEDWQLAHALVEGMGTALSAFMTTRDAGTIDLVALADLHRAAVLQGSTDDAGTVCVLEGTDGEALVELFDDLACANVTSVHGGFNDYPPLFAGLANERVIRRVRSGHRRVRIWGQLEARLLDADRLILAGLDEGIWPPATQVDAFLNRPLRAAMGLPSPERRVGQSAHDFAQSLGVHDVMITRALKREDSPTVASRLVQRMAAYAGEPLWANVTSKGERYLALARLLDQPDQAAPLARPEPKPPLRLIPMSLSVTEVATLTRDPYAIYAKHVLRLDPLEGLALAPGASERGRIIHAAVGRFAQDWPEVMPPDGVAKLIAIGKEAFAPYADFPDVTGLWWPRFEAIANAFIAWENDRREMIASLTAECWGGMDIPLPDRSVFRLRAQADRIETRTDGTVTILDFKTGQPPSTKQVYAGFDPQLTLEAAMVRGGAFKSVQKHHGAFEMLYVRLGGRAGLEPKPVKPTKPETRDPNELIDIHLTGLMTTVAKYRSGELGFTSRVAPQYIKRVGDYDHLARVKEWSRTGGASDDSGSDGESGA
jgi:ATP-dependent helicase/nuclease subunit B